MKNFIILLFCLLSFNSWSADTEVDVLSAEIGVKDYTDRKTLCLTIVRVPQSGALLGVVESIEDCFYARSARKSHNHKIRLPLKKLQRVDEPLMQQHLQSIDTQVEYYFSDFD